MVDRSQWSREEYDSGLHSRRGEYTVTLRDCADFQGSAEWRRRERGRAFYR